MYVPVYRLGMPTDTIDCRRAALKGFVYIPIRINDFVRGTLGRLPADIAFEIFDGDACTASKRMYDSLQVGRSSLPAHYRPTFASTKSVGFHGCTWTLSFETLPAFDSEINRIQSLTVLLGGTVVSALLSFVALILLRTRATAAALANRMTAALRESEKRFAIMANSAPVLIWMADAEVRCTWLNQALGGLYRREPRAAVGKGMDAKDSP